MTNEEAIKVLQSLIPVPKRGDTRSTETTEISVALIMAISALSQIESAGTQITNSNLKSESEKLDGDLISRKAVNKLRKYNLVGGIHTVSLDDINKLPSAEKTTITDTDLISRTDLLNAIWQKEYGKDYDGVNMLNIPHIDIIENMPSYNPIKTELSGDLIPRQAVITMLNKIENAIDDGDGFQFNEWIYYAKHIPSAEKTAEWIIHPVYAHLVCSNCLSNAPYDCKTNFCPTCGSYMRKEVEE